MKMAEILLFWVENMIFQHSYAIKSVYVKKNCEKCAFYFHNRRSANVKDVWFDSYDEEYFSRLHIIIIRWLL